MSSPRANFLIEITGEKIPVREGSLLHEGFIALRSCHGKRYQEFRDQAGGAKGSKSRRYSPSAVLNKAERTGFARLLSHGGATRTDNPNASAGRLPSARLHEVTAEHVRQAVFDTLDQGWSSPFTDSRSFDLITDDGERLPPKVVFGRAATLALGFSVLPSHFSGGEGTPCFRVLRRAGYAVVPKDQELPVILEFTADDLTWSEGSQQLVHHLRRERARGAAQAKRDSFRQEHGRLFCEKCNFDPMDHYGGPEGEACIEVHHNATTISEMTAGHRTRLADLQCLCANCHRVVHKLMKMTT
ncbi:HNH endonuclease [Paracoccus marcusii]|uniref:HNH endonuclease n=1 Tax=Paracoccus marcusii TaxID=59779 RepID=UPI0024904DEE|nr:hypothetical protein [Paracoccus marcusii]